MNKPLVSIIIPTYNHGQYLPEAIDSVLRQSVEPIEIIIIDDGSIDNTEVILKNLTSNVRYYRQSHQGAGAARNTGVTLAKGKWLAFLDADDLWLPQKLTLQLVCAEQKSVDIVFSHIQQFISPELRVGKLAEIKMNNEVMPGYCASTVLIKKEVFADIGCFNPSYKLGEFMAWYMMMQGNGAPYYLLDDILVRRRVHTNNTSSVNKKDRQDYLRVIYEAQNSCHRKIMAR